MGRPLIKQGWVAGEYRKPRYDPALAGTTPSYEAPYQTRVIPVSPRSNAAEIAFDEYLRDGFQAWQNLPG